MKTLKLDHELAQMVLAGSKTATWRLFDDKNLSVGDAIKFIDKVDPERPDTWKAIGAGHVHKVIQKKLGEIGPEDGEGHESFTSTGEMLSTYQKYYGSDVSIATNVKLIHFDFTPY